jgi:hypothetical protein
MRGEWAGHHVFQVQLDSQVSQREAGICPQVVGHHLEVGQGARVRIDGQEDRQDIFQESKSLSTFRQFGCPK